MTDKSNTNKSHSNKSHSNKSHKGTTLVADNTRIVGTVEFQDQLYVNGLVEGNIVADPNSKATLIVSRSGHVVGQISVPYVVIDGLVEGDVRAHVRMELAPNARISGNVYYRLIEMQLGSKVDGQMLHVDDLVDDQNVHQLHDAEQSGTA